MSTLDALGRPMHDLRISVTDRCNFRCVYCMPREVFGRDFAFAPREDLLSFEEIARVTGVFAGLGVRKVRLTGGEPLLRRELERLITMLARIEGIEDIALTTNGALLTREKARELRAAGLRRITVSLDSLDDERFRSLSDVDVPVERVLEAIDAAVDAGLAPVKVDVVVLRGRNDRDIVEIADRFRGSGIIVRFIEYMDVGNTNGWRMEDVVSGAEIRALIEAHWPLVAGERGYPGEVAARWQYQDGAGEIGIISSVTHPFCGDCTRARLSAVGELFTCLFGASGHDVRSMLRGGASDEELGVSIASIWRARTDRYSEIRSAQTAALRKVEMSRIGG